MKKPSVTAKRPTQAPTRTLRMPDFSHSLPMLLLRGREAVMRYFRPDLQNHGVTEQQWRVLRALSSVDEMEVLMLANATYLLAPSMSRILKDMQRRGLISRRSDKNDLRRNLVAISDKGIELIATLSPSSEAAYTEIYRRFGARNFNLLQELLRDLETQLQDGVSARPRATTSPASQSEVAKVSRRRPKKP